MLKRIGHIAIVFLLLISTTGITINKHFCCGRLIAFSLFSKPEPCCKGVCNSCHDESKHIKITNPFESSSLLEISGNFYIFLQIFCCNDFLIKNTPVTLYRFISDISPPKLIDSASFLQVFRL
ncbi:MAG: hypothetical protein HY738_11420 [Bacteroidia bacterium]|nr:hypothetical protein [Bacteroidia bacterium]